MNRWQVTRLLACWEFQRFFKWKGQLISWGIGVVLMIGIAVLGPRLMNEAMAESARVGVLGTTPFALPPALGVEWVEGEPEPLEADYAADDLDALLAFEDESSGLLRSHAEAGWIQTLRAALDVARRQLRLTAHGLDPAVLADVTAGFELEVRRDDEHHPDHDHAADDHTAPDDGSSGKPSRWDRIIALAMLGFMFGGVFSGTALLFTGITSEKQQLVTEQIVAAVPAQTWIDGKILGIGFRAVTGTLEMVAWSLIGMFVWRDFVNPEFVGLEEVSPTLLTTIALLATLGFALWFCVFAALAATIDDPNTSARGMLLLLPMVAPVLAIPAWFQPDGPLATVLSLLPPSATMAMSVRLALTEVPAWQLAVAVVGMLVSIALLRRAAGKVFAMAILMRGKELTWREMWTAARHS